MNSYSPIAFSTFDIAIIRSLFDVFELVSAEN